MSGTPIASLDHFYRQLMKPPAKEWPLLVMRIDERERFGALPFVIVNGSTREERTWNPRLTRGLHPLP